MPTQQNHVISVAEENLLGLMERVKGIEPSYEAWEAAVLPLNYTRSGVVPQPWAGQSRDYSAAFLGRGGPNKPAPVDRKFAAINSP